MSTRNLTRTIIGRLVIITALVCVDISGQEPTKGAAPGRLVDVGGHKLHIHCAGQGAPTVVIDGGAGAWSIHFTHIQKAISAARVCTYDRAGLGWSDIGPLPRTSERMVQELHALLHGAGVAPPLILVGHSLGGYNVRLYQARYPEEVGALVLLDPAHEQQWDRLPPQARQLTQASVAALRKRAEQARSGALKPEDVTPAGVFVTRSPELRETYVAAMLTPKPHEGLAAESEASFESARQVPTQRLGKLPLIVLTARRSFDAFKGSGIPIEESNSVWLALQNELASLSDNSRHLFSEGHHRLHEVDPTAVVSAIQLGISAVKERPLPFAALGLQHDVLPLRSTPAVDRLLDELEVAYRSKDVERFVNLFTEDVTQLDVNRRVHVKGRASWTEWTHRINGAHRDMERRHRGRAIIGDWIIVEIEWAGTVRGEALGAPGRDFSYRYTGLGLQRIQNGRIQQQILYGDYATLTEQLSGGGSSGDRSSKQ